VTRRVIVEPGAKADINEARDKTGMRRYAPDRQDFYDAVIEVVDRLQLKTEGACRCLMSEGRAASL